MANSEEKKRAPIFVGRWKRLDCAGDVKRMLRQIALQTFADKMPLRKARTLAQVGLALLKAIEVADLETQLLQLEEHRGNSHAPVDETRIAH